MRTYAAQNGPVCDVGVKLDSLWVLGLYLVLYSEHSFLVDPRLVSMFWNTSLTSHLFAIPDNIFGMTLTTKSKDRIPLTFPETHPVDLRPQNSYKRDSPCCWVCHTTAIGVTCLFRFRISNKPPSDGKASGWRPTDGLARFRTLRSVWIQWTMHLPQRPSKHVSEWYQICSYKIWPSCCRISIK